MNSQIKSQDLVLAFENELSSNCDVSGAKGSSLALL
jgi:hypothetical protein